jgi:hypothetical protein
VIGRIFADRRRLAATRRADRLAAVVIAIVQAGVAAAGWLVEPVWLAVAIAAQLGLGGLAAVYVIGPARHELGLARYAMPSVAAIAATVFGRLIPGGQSLLLTPFVAVLLWAVTYLELRIERGTGGGTIQALLMTSIVFCGAAGIVTLFGPHAWPTPMIVVAGLTLPVAMRAAEARGTLGVEAVGQSLLHLLVVVQVGLAATLLNVAPTILGALTALAFYAWGGAVEALGGEDSGRSIALEFGALVLLGIVVGLLLYRPG